MNNDIVQDNFPEWLISSSSNITCFKQLPLCSERKSPTLCLHTFNERKSFGQTEAIDTDLSD